MQRIFEKYMKKSRFESFQKVERWPRTFSPLLNTAGIHYKENYELCELENVLCLRLYFVRILLNVYVKSAISFQYVWIVIGFPKRIFENLKKNVIGVMISLTFHTFL